MSSDMILGEMRGQLREVVHSLNNLTQKFDVLSKEVVGLAVMGAEVAAMKVDVSKLQNEMADLSEDRHRRDGATSFLSTLLKSPILGWVVGFISLGIAIFKGWVKIQ